MSPKKPVTDINLPDIEKCPNCGHNIFLGETECSNCGYDVSNWEQKLQSINPQMVAVFLFILGVLTAISVFSTDNDTVRAILLIIGSGLIISGGLVMTADYFLEDVIQQLKRWMKQK